MEWPSEFSVDAFNNHFNLALSRASKCHLNPSDDGAPSIRLRLLWWPSIAEPPMDSPYFTAAQEARAVTSQLNTTVAHRAEWQSAMIKSITTYSKAGVGKPVGGVSRGQVSARFGGSACGGCARPVPSWATEGGGHIVTTVQSASRDAPWVASKT